MLILHYTPHLKVEINPSIAKIKFILCGYYSLNLIPNNYLERSKDSKFLNHQRSEGLKHQNDWDEVGKKQT